MFPIDVIYREIEHLRETINLNIQKIDSDIEAKCKLLDSEINTLRTEWRLEHANLIQRYEESERSKAIAKIEVDKHFENINSLQARMDKLSETFITKEDAQTLFSNYTKNTWISNAAIWALILSGFIAHLFGKI
jgi:hypothetical protein